MEIRDFGVVFFFEGLEGFYLRDFLGGFREIWGGLGRFHWLTRLNKTLAPPTLLLASFLHFLGHLGPFWVIFSHFHSFCVRF